ncbi:MAG: LemA family protein [Candidatus Gracilibacteria bacterium]|nr:LemA family protein [Candidatus Gracilibacteria bacterium]
MNNYIIIGVIAVLVIYVIMQYNRLVALRNNRENAFADIDVQLKLRFDLVPNLIETVKGYATHEKSVFENVSQARAAFVNAGNADEKIEANNMLTGALKSVFALAEAYPDLKANTNFLQLQNELSDIENKISAARRFFNSATNEFNTYLQGFPTNIFAGIFGFKAETMFQIENEAERQNVKVSF